MSTVANTIEITSNPGRVVKFEGFWSNAQGQIYYGPAPLNNISIASGVTGNISIEINRNPFGPFNGPNEPDGNPPGNIIISTNGASILARANLRRNGGPADICFLRRLKVGVLGNPDNPADTVDIDFWDGSIIVGGVFAGGNSAAERRMTIEQIREVHEARPFRPFTMVLADGSRVRVRSPEFLAHPGRGRTVIVFDRGESYHVIDLLLLTALEVGAVRNGRSGRRAG